MKYPKGSHEPVSDHFKAREFDCPCKEQSCKETLIEPDLIQKLQALRDFLGHAVRITSAYRCDWYQKDLARRGYETAKGISTHQLGQAVDITTGRHTGSELERLARKAGFRAVGRGMLWVHLDLRSDRDRSWGYSR